MLNLTLPRFLITLSLFLLSSHSSAIAEGKLKNESLAAKDTTWLRCRDKCQDEKKICIQFAEGAPIKGGKSAVTSQPTGTANSCDSDYASCCIPACYVNNGYEKPLGYLNHPENCKAYLNR
jgi:hypothetical protein